MPQILNKNGWRSMAQLRRQIRSVLPDEIIIVRTNELDKRLTLTVKVDIDNDPRPDALAQARAAVEHLNARLDGACVISLVLEET